MRMNADHYSLTQDKLWYTITRVTGKAKDQVLLYCIDNTVDLTDLSAFEELMQNSFKDSDWQGTAQTTIQRLCQWNQDFSTYLAEFNCHVEYTKWNEEAKKSALLTEISDELRQLLITVNTTTLNLGGLTCTLQIIDNCHWAVQQVTYNNTRARVITLQNRAFTTNTSPVTPQVTRTWGSAITTSATPLIITQWVSVLATGENPMNLSVAQPCLREPLSVTEKTHRMQHNLCLYCRGEEHKAMICTAKPSVQMQLRQISFETIQPEGLKKSKNK